MTEAAVIEKRARKRPDRLPNDISKAYTVKKLESFLKAYSECGNMSKAAEKTGICRRTVNNYMDSSPEFAERVEDAKITYLGHLEEALNERTIGEGTVRRTVGPDGQTTMTYTQSDKLLELALKRRDPAYRDNNGTNININAPEHVNIVQLPPADRVKRLKGMLDRANEIEAAMPVKALEEG